MTSDTTTAEDRLRDHVNLSQSSNDSFPTAMNMAEVVAVIKGLAGQAFQPDLGEEIAGPCKLVLSRRYSLAERVDARRPRTVGASTARRVPAGAGWGCQRAHEQNPSILLRRGTGPAMSFVEQVRVLMDAKAPAFCFIDFFGD
jgi:hypothetical protein